MDELFSFWSRQNRPKKLKRQKAKRQKDKKTKRREDKQTKRQKDEKTRRREDKQTKSQKDKKSKNQMLEGQKSPKRSLSLNLFETNIKLFLFTVGDNRYQRLWRFQEILGRTISMLQPRTRNHLSPLFLQVGCIWNK